MDDLSPVSAGHSLDGLSLDVGDHDVGDHDADNHQDGDHQHGDHQDGGHQDGGHQDGRDHTGQRPGAGMPVFEGAAELLECLRLVVRRPRLRESQGSAGHLESGKRRPGVPMLCLIRQEDDGALLQALARFLVRARPQRIPHVIHSYPRAAVAGGRIEVCGAPPPSRQDDIQPICDDLLALSRGLSTGANGRNGRIRFIRFGLVRWLVNQNLEVDDADSDSVLRARLRARDLGRARYAGVFTTRLPELIDDAMPRWAKVLQLLPPLWFLVRISGRLRGVGPEYRWLLRQPYLAPRDPGTFLGFAERLSAGQRPKEDPEQVLRLLVHAFLTDITRAYRRRPWRFRAARRTTYPVALLDGITRTNRGYRLLRLINDVRNDTGRFDPLLIISGSQAVPPDAAPADDALAHERVWPATRAVRAHDAWRAGFPASSRARDRTAWYLPIQIPPLLTRQHPQSDGYLSAVQELQRTAILTVEEAPIWARRSTMACLLVILLVAAGGAGRAWHHSQVGIHARQAEAAEQIRQAALRNRTLHCGRPVSDPYAATLTLSARVGDPHGPKECIGITDGSYSFQPGDRPLTQVLAKIHQQDQNSLLTGSRPHYTLIYVGAMTSANNKSDDFVGDQESLTGVARAQNELFRNDNGPVLKVLVANAGTGMTHGVDLARTIGAMALRDSSIVGVIGMDESRQATIDTIAALTDQGLTTVAGTLSATQISDQAGLLYFQVSPTDAREAQVAAAYAGQVLAPAGSLGTKGHLGQRSVQVLTSNDRSDLYSSDLADKVTSSFQDAGFQVLARLPYTPAGGPSTALSAQDQAVHLCGYPGLVFFTGRPSDFEALLQGVKDCPGAPPTILGGDDVSRYVAADTDRTDQHVPFSYLSFAVGRASHPQDTRDGHANTGYDTVMVYLHAITKISGWGRRVLRALIPTAIRGSTFKGHSGWIAFTGTSSENTPAQKAVAVLKVTGNREPWPVGTCQPHSRTSATWCP